MGSETSAREIGSILKKYWGFDGFAPCKKRPSRPRCDGRDSLVVHAHRRRQVALLPGSRPLIARPHRRRRLAAHLADEGPGRRPAPGRRARARAFNSAPRPPKSARGRWPACASGELTLLFVAPERLVSPPVPGVARRRRVVPRSSPSTRPTASAIGATTSGPSTAQLADLKELFPGAPFTPTPRRPPPRVRDGHRRAARPARSRRCSSAASTARTSSTASSPAATARASSRGRSAATRGEAGIVYCISRKETEIAAPVSQAADIARAPTTPGSTPRIAARNQDAFRDERSTSSSPPSPSAWGSTGATSASSSTPPCPSRSSTTSRRPAAPVATA